MKKATRRKEQIVLCYVVATPRTLATWSFAIGASWCRYGYSVGCRCYARERAIVIAAQSLEAALDQAEQEFGAIMLARKPHASGVCRLAG